MKAVMPNKSLTVFSWALYDFANAIFGINVIALYFVLWVTINKGAEDIVYGFTLGVSMFLAAVSMPILGAISDRSKERMRFLIFFTLLCVVFLALIGRTKSLTLGLLFFGASNFGYLLSGAVFYNALLTDVADREWIGRVSGYGVSLSYIGTIVGLLAIRPIALRFGYQETFIPIAFLFLLFASPCFFFVKEKAEKRPARPLQLIREAFNNLIETLRGIRASKDLFNFFLAIFIIINVVNSVFIFMSVYLKKVLLFLDSEIISLYIISTLFSIIGSLVSGLVTDKIGAKKTLTGAILICGIAIFIGVISFGKYPFWIIGPMVGLAFSAIRVSGRALAVRLFPEEKIGEVFGLLGFLSNLAFIGLLIWGALIFLFAPLGVMRYRIALFALLAILAAGLAILQKSPSDKF